MANERPAADQDAGQGVARRLIGGIKNAASDDPWPDLSDCTTDALTRVRIEAAA